MINFKKSVYHRFILITLCFTPWAMLHVLQLLRNMLTCALKKLIIDYLYNWWRKCNNLLIFSIKLFKKIFFLIFRYKHIIGSINILIEWVCWMVIDCVLDMYHLISEIIQLAIWCSQYLECIIVKILKYASYNLMTFLSKYLINHFFDLFLDNFLDFLLCSVSKWWH